VIIRKAKGRRPKSNQAGRMTKAEAAFRDRLTVDVNRGIIQWFRFEALKLRLADRTWYTPDFVVMDEACILNCFEIKEIWAKDGKPHWEDDARVKFKVVAEQYPILQFTAAAWNRSTGQWTFEVMQ